MSEVAGRLSVQMGTRALERQNGGRGVPLGGRFETLFSTAHTVEAMARTADLLVGAVLVPGARAPHRRDPGSRRHHEAGRRQRGRRGGPGGLCRDHPPHHPRRAHLHRGGGGALRGHQHAGGRAPHLDLRAAERHPPLGPGPGRQGLAHRLPGGRRPRQGPQRGPREGGVPGGGRGPWAPPRELVALVSPPGTGSPPPRASPPRHPTRPDPPGSATPAASGWCPAR